MMISERLRNAAIVSLVIVLSITGIAFVQDEMVEVRDEHHLTEVGALDGDEVSPVVAFTTLALGGFRGLLADILFLRSQSMHESGNYFELVQLADWLVKLQPRFTGATAYLAWNMAYNVSVTFNAPEDRWRWVQRGIELIRDEALNYSDDDPVLFHELGWIYQHKVGHILDDANWYYKRQLAMQIIHVTGQTGRIDWRAFADAPNTKEELYASLSQKQVEALDAILESRQMTMAQLEEGFRSIGNFPEFEMIDELAEAELLEPMNLYLRSRWLRQGYRLEPEFIAPIIDDYGYLDFRMPEAHAIYWAKRGLAASHGGVNVKCDRMVNQSMMNAFKSGTIIYLPEEGPAFEGPNLDIVDAVRDQYLYTMREHQDNNSFRSGWENFMKDAVVMLYAGGRVAKANEYLQRLRSDFPSKRDYRVDIHTFAKKELKQDVEDKSLKQTRAILVQTIITSYMHAAAGNMEAAYYQMEIAIYVHRVYNAEKTSARQMNRTGLPPLEILQAGILTDLLNPEMSPLSENARATLLVALGLPPGTTQVQPTNISGNMLESRETEDLPLQNN
jgi:hypothetical protein